MRISDWSSDVCSSDLTIAVRRDGAAKLVAQLDQQDLPAPPAAIAADTDLHVAVRELLAATVTMPQRTARIDDALDGIFLHPIFEIGRASCRERVCQYV